MNNIISKLEKYIRNELVLDFYNDDMPCELIINKMEKMIKRGLAAAMTAFMAFSVAACSGGGGSPSNEPAPAAPEDVGELVAEEGADLARIENEIVTMPNYFADYDTTVHFISMEEMKANHSGIPHGGFVIRTGKTGWNEEFNNVIEYSLKLDSNPEFTASVLVAYARAAYRMNKEGQKGCKTVFDVAPAYLCKQSGEELRAHML